MVKVFYTVDGVFFFSCCAIPVMVNKDEYVYIRNLLEARENAIKCSIFSKKIIFGMSTL